MAMNRHRVSFIEIPDSVTPVAANRSDTYRYLLNHALKNKLLPILADLPNLSSGVMLIYPNELAKIEEVAETYKLSNAATFAGLCAAAVKSLKAEKAEKTRDEKKYLQQTVGFGSLKDARPDQAKYYEGMLLGLRKCKIVMAEASTGVGKGRAMMALAVDAAKEGKQPVIVAAPTLTVMSHLYDEFLKLNIKDIKVAIVPGKGEFVDDVKLTEYVQQADILDGEKCSQAIADWVQNSGKSLIETNLSKTMSAMGVPPGWLMDDLISIAGDFPADDFKLSDETVVDSISKGLLDDYKQAIGDSAKVIICSHTMLAIAAARTKKSENSEDREWHILPEPSVIFIDEAHQFETAVAQVNSDQLSVFSLRWRLTKHKRDNSLKSGTVVSEALKFLNEFTRVSQRLENASSQMIVLNEPRNEFESKSFGDAISVLAKLKGKLSSKSLNEVPGIKADRAALSSISFAASSASTSERITLVFSPTKNYPSVLSGKANMRSQLGAIWNKAAGGVVLASATLYMPDPDGTMKCDYVRDILALPLHRIYAPAPIESKHIYSIPVLHYPSKEKLAGLCAPGSKANKLSDLKQAVDDWLKNAAKAIFEGPGLNAAGGTLVLCTAYTQLSGISDELIALGVSTNRIVSQERGKKFSVSQDEFVGKYRAGLRPILLGLGIAWTGLDMADKTVKDDDAKNDRLLTDLVILRSPIGLNRTNSMASRIMRHGNYPIEKEALLLLKQGLGRLIRRENVVDRHIWILDGRLWSAWKGMENFAASARQLLAKYKKVKVF